LTRAATIAEAAKRGELSSEHAREMSAEQYQVTHMQFELLSLWLGIKERNSREFPMLKQHRIQRKKAKS